MTWLAGTSQAQDQPTPILVPLGGIKEVQMTTKKAIKKAEVKRDGIVNIKPVPGDPTKITLVGVAPETTTLELTDENGKTESYLVIVQRDVENLRAQLRRNLPTANITVEPISESAVVLKGTVARAADTLAVEAIASALGFRPINQLMVAGPQQVQLDVVVAIVSRSEFRRMAFDFLFNSKNFFFASTGAGAVGVPATIGTSGALTSAAGGLVGTVGSPNGAASNILFGVLHQNANFLGFLQALRDDNILKLMAEPKLVTISGRPASFLAGGEQAIPVPAGLGQVGVQFEEFGTRLNFLPIVLGDGRIHLEVEPEVSTLDPANGTVIQGTVVPGRDTHRVNTTVELEVGHTFVIGGLIQHTVLGSTTKVPILGDLPFAGVFFSRKEYQETEDEVLILVTPHLVEAVDCSQAPKVLPGEETRSPDDFELFLEGILEAPRGQRCVFEGHDYVAPYKHSPSANMYPCGDKCPGCFSGVGGRGCGTGGCGTGNGGGGCASGNCGAPAPRLTPTGTSATLTPTVPQALPVATPVVPTADTSATAPTEEQPATVPAAAPAADPALAPVPGGTQP
jgi:pilus assembly protein CpaC